MTTTRSERQAPWYGAGYDMKDDDGNTIITGTKLATSEVAQRAHLDWKAKLVEPITVEHDGKRLLVPGRAAVVRTDTSAVLGDVGRTFSVFQHESMLEFGASLVDQAEAEWVMAGPLRGGKQAFAALRLPEEVSIVGDPHSNHIVLLNAHDGSAKFKAMVWSLRHACGNQVAAAVHGALQQWGIRHVGDLHDRVEEAREALTLTVSYVEEFKSIAERLAVIDFEVSEAEDLLKVVIPDATSPRGQVAIDSQRAAVKENWLRSETIPEDWRKTRWGFYNGLTEWAEHKRTLRSDRRGNSNERRFLSNVDQGPVAQLRERTFRSLAVR